MSTSGFRSTATQQRLYDQAIAKYGSPRAAATWLEKRGVRYGICRRYVNEWWHFERLAPAIGQRCPTLEPHAGG